MYISYYNLSLCFQELPISTIKNCIETEIYNLILEVINNKKKWFMFEENEMKWHLTKMKIGDSYRVAWNNINQNDILITKIKMSPSDTVVLISPEPPKYCLTDSLPMLPPSPPPELEEEIKEYTVFCTKNISNFFGWFIKTFIVDLESAN